MYDQLVALTGPVRYEICGRGHLKMANHPFPWSITNVEFTWITDFVKSYNLKAGFEVATAFGISSLAAALAMKETGGKLVTMDAYIEEASNDPLIYRHAQPQTYEQADGYRSVNYLISQFDLENTLIPFVGWSPINTAEAITSVFGDDAQLDYAFIDAGHFEEAVLADLNAIAPFMKKGGFVLFHDVYDYCFTPAVHARVRELTGNDIDIVLPPPQGDSLGVLQW